MLTDRPGDLLGRSCAGRVPVNCGVRSQVDDSHRFLLHTNFEGVASATCTHQARVRSSCTGSSSARRPRRGRSAVLRRSRVATLAPNERWSIDSMSDAVADGRRVRVLTILDAFTRGCVALDVAARFTGADVAHVLDGIRLSRGAPQMISVDNGPEFTSTALNRWV